MEEEIPGKVGVTPAIQVQSRGIKIKRMKTTPAVIQSGNDDSFFDIEQEVDKNNPDLRIRSSSNPIYIRIPKIPSLSHSYGATKLEEMEEEEEEEEIGNEEDDGKVCFFLIFFIDKPFTKIIIFIILQSLYLLMNMQQGKDLQLEQHQMLFYIEKRTIRIYRIFVTFDLFKF